MELKLILIGLPLIEIAIFIWLLIRKDKSNKRAHKIKQDRHMEPDDLPGRYMEIQHSERPFIEHY